MWSRIRPRCAISLGKSNAVAFSNSRSPRECEFATDTPPSPVARTEANAGQGGAVVRARPAKVARRQGPAPGPRIDPPSGPRFAGVPQFDDRALFHSILLAPSLFHRRGRRFFNFRPRSGTAITQLTLRGSPVIVLELYTFLYVRSQRRDDPWTMLGGDECPGRRGFRELASRHSPEQGGTKDAWT